MIGISRRALDLKKQSSWKSFLTLLLTLYLALISQTTVAASGLFFNISATGSPDNLSITLCLNGKGPLSCQNYTVSALNLNINTTIPNHVYPGAGIKINTPGYSPSGCTPISNGYCLFSASNTVPANIIIRKEVLTIKATSGSNGAINPHGLIKINYGGSQQFTATPAADYAVNQWLVDGVAVQTGGGTYTLANVTTDHTVEVTFAQGLTPSVSPLALSVNCPSPGTLGCVYTNPALTGQSRQITITNKGSIPVTNVSVTAHDLPSGTSIASTTCSGNLNVMDSCIIVVKPGALASSDCTNGSAPANGTITVTTDEAMSSQVDVFVLSYSCLYQGGYVFAVNDTTSQTKSIGGKIITTSNQATEDSPGIIWSSNSSGSYDDGVSLWGIDDTSTVSAPSPNASSYDPATQYPGQLNCNGASDGACNSNNIITYYKTIASPPPPLSSYAAGLCKATINDHSDWYLPAICEMGPDDGSMICTSPPLMQLEQNMLDSLPVLINNCTGTQCLAGEYWSSTELSGNPLDIAWAQCFASNGGTQCVEGKNETLGVRCARALTY